MGLHWSQALSSRSAWMVVGHLKLAGHSKRMYFWAALQIPPHRSIQSRLRGGTSNFILCITLKSTFYFVACKHYRYGRLESASISDPNDIFLMSCFIIFSGSKTVEISGTGSTKRRFTVMFCAPADGKLIAIMIIFKDLKTYLR